MAIRVDAWKMSIGVSTTATVRREGLSERAVHLECADDPLEKVTPDSEENRYEGRKFVGQKLWVPTAAGPFLAEHLKACKNSREPGVRHAQHEEGGEAP